jgi:hypothetical protein
MDSSKHYEYCYTTCPSCEKKIKVKTPARDVSTDTPIDAPMDLRVSPVFKTPGKDKSEYNSGYKSEYKSGLLGQSTKKPLLSSKTGESAKRGIVSPLHTHLPSDQDDKKPEEGHPHLVKPIHSAPPREVHAYEVKKLKDDTKAKSDNFFTNPRKRLKVAFFVLIIVFILGVSHGIFSIVQGANERINSDYEKPEYVDVYGKVIDSKTGLEIENCRISIIGTAQRTESNQDGQFFIPSVKSGEHEIKAEASGYVEVIKIVTIDPELMGIIHFELDEGVGAKKIDESVSTTQRLDGDNINIFGVLIIIFACFALLSAILVFQRSFFYLCSFCAFISIMSLGAGIGMVLAIVAFILIVLSSNGFEKKMLIPTNVED